MVSPPQPTKQTHRLKYTGSKDQQSFERECAKHDFWYHSFYFDNGFQQLGDYDIGQNIEQYGFPQDMSGMSVLDVGTGSGWFACYFEQLGANVTTVDARGYSDFDVFGRYKYPPIEKVKAQADQILSNGQEIYYSPVSKGFWIMKEILGLKAEYVNARIYDICPELFDGKTFDLVFLGSLLMHLRDPIGALMAVRSVCKERIISNTLILDGDSEEITEVPVMMLLSDDQDNYINWWQPTKACVIQWFKAAGFPEVTIDKTVDLITDKIYVDDKGNSSGCNQTLYLVDASISNQNSTAESSLLHIQQQPLTTKRKLETTQQELAITKTKLDKTQQELELNKAQLDKTQQALEITKTKLGATQQELEFNNAQLDKTRQELRLTNAQLDKTQQELEITKAKLDETQQQAQQITARLKQSEGQLQTSQTKLNELELLLTAIESSKFWKLRRWWFAIKRKFNLASEDILYQNYLSSSLNSNDDISVK